MLKTIPCTKCDGTGRLLDQVAMGKHMREYRINAGMSLRQVADELKLSASYISDLELGRRNWTPKVRVDFERVCENNVKSKP